MVNFILGILFVVLIFLENTILKNGIKLQPSEGFCEASVRPGYQDTRLKTDEYGSSANGSFGHVFCLQGPAVPHSWGPDHLCHNCKLDTTLVWEL